jgi:hypothetical protein
MELAAALLVHGPLPIAALATVHLVISRHLHRRGSPGSRPWLVAGLAWLAYAGWELMVMLVSPEANIRVDLLVIWPLLLCLSGWALRQLFRARPPTAPDRSVGSGRERD